ncbi:hypothetical protein X727_32995 [Mesorhizobium sp. L103C119B0]|nr:hypothetical protein X727_32995 [Mesorhizobium sp. L103C119B0]
MKAEIGLNISFLIEEGFMPVGSWRTADCRPHRDAAWVRHQPGLYAFVVGSAVMYIGLSETLHRRLRRYGNRAFRNKNVPQRGPHINIALSVAGNIEVPIFAKVIPGATEALLLPLETALIKALQPGWNDTHKI